MLLILWLAVGIAVLLFVILCILENIRIKKKNISKEKRYGYVKKRFFRKLVVCVVFLFIMVQGVPWLIWHFSPKEEKFQDKVTINEQIYPLQDVEGTYYLGILTDSKGKRKYAANIMLGNGINQQILDPKSVEVVNGKAGDKPVYKKIEKYKLVRLKTDKYKLVRQSINDMYGYISGYKETKIGEKINITIPKGTMLEDYGVKDITQ